MPGLWGEMVEGWERGHDNLNAPYLDGGKSRNRTGLGASPLRAQRSAHGQTR